MLSKPLSGVLFFPVTPFFPGGTVDLDTYRRHVEHGLRHGPGGIFAACGTGEFHALSQAEYGDVVATAVKAADGAVPVFAGAGGSPPAMRAQARLAEEAGVDGLLVMPPYLVRASGHGLHDYVRSLASECGLPLIVYNRDNAALDVDTAVRVARIPSVIGLKDGVGNIDQISRIVVAVRAALAADGDPKVFRFFNGLSTAEMTQRAYRGIGVSLYSSAVFAFAPEVSTAFWRTLEAGDREFGDRLLREFYAPLAQLRDEVPGYAISLIKAGVRFTGLDAGGVRAPLTDPSGAHLARLREIYEAGLALVAVQRAGARPDTEDRA
ncbi:MAG TPA: 5-dehydro-4-deoxyglucarate dehydratase [Streptosporangiaceae bacterium]|nr:5-dehydro-4-deoxyglucarate dehydratase [Streptosporangiaceae bacterium]